jgi:hypothetical protein
MASGGDEERRILSGMYGPRRVVGLPSYESLPEILRSAGFETRSMKARAERVVAVQLRRRFGNLAQKVTPMLVGPSTCLRN